MKCSTRLSVFSFHLQNWFQQVFLSNFKDRIINSHILLLDDQFERWRIYFFHIIVLLFLDLGLIGVNHRFCVASDCFDYNIILMTQQWNIISIIVMDDWFFFLFSFFKILFYLVLFVHINRNLVYYQLDFTVSFFYLILI